MSEKKSVLFVCLGNICRSPMAEAIFIDILRKRGEFENWHVDSSAMVGYHTGKQPEKRTLSTLEKLGGIKDYRHTVRVTRKEDFDTFDYIFGMDDDNMADLEQLRSSRKAPGKAIVEKFSKYDGSSEVPDPYYNSGTREFEQVYHQLVKCCNTFLDGLN